MGELADLVGIYGEIDRAVGREDGRRAAVSRLMPEYREPVQWFDDFVAWTDELRHERTDAAPFPSLDQALEDLGGITAEGRMRARRLWVIALALQAFPGLRADERLADLARRALRFDGITNDAERADAILDRLAAVPEVDDGDGADPDGWWEALLADLADEGLVADARSFGPRPCTGKLVTLP